MPVQKRRLPVAGMSDRIDRDEMVLLVIDPQVKLAAVMGDRERVLDRTSKLVRLAGLIGAPVIATRQYPKGLGDLEPDVVAPLDALAANGGSVDMIDKLSFCACGEQAFLDAVADSGRGQVVVTGMETHICVTQTALDLLDRGFRVHVVSDACCSRSADDHDTALARLRAAGAVVTVTESVLYEAVPTAGTDEFRSLLGIVKD